MNNQYAGMTINERLYLSGQMIRFDSAVRRKDIKEVILILKKIEITDERSINDVLKSLGLNNTEK